MATFSVTTSPDQDRAVQYFANRYNAENPTATMTVLEYARMLIDHMLGGQVQQWKVETRTTKGELYTRASDADQATIDAILNKYR